MKFSILLPASTALLVAAVAWAFTGCTNAARSKFAGNPLPASCTLLAMSPEQRAAQERRLKKLQKASHLLRETASGFAFAVNLNVLSAHDLQLWMENEQKCCSFLRMTSHIQEGGSCAEVRVECPPDLRSEVLRTFGLNTEL